jgi:hypothetical protein
MFKNSFILGAVAGLTSTLACYVYSNFYYSIIVDFSEAVNLTTILAGCFGFAMLAAVIRYGIKQVIKRDRIAELCVNLIISMFTIGLVFYMLNTNDPEFKNEDAQLMVDFYKGFVMPMLSFPALAWFTFTPLFVKKS